MGRKEAEAVPWMDSDVLHHLLKFCKIRNFPAEQPSFEKQRFNRSTAFWAFCHSVLSISRHLTGWGTEHFICESVLPMQERLLTQGWEEGAPIFAYLQVYMQGCNILASFQAIYLWVARKVVLQNLRSVVLLYFRPNSTVASACPPVFTEPSL